MFQIAPSVRIIGYVIFAGVGLAIGAVSGILASLALKLRIRHVALDAVLGTTGFMTVWFVTTQGHYPYPMLAAAVAAAIFPVIHELARFKRSGTAAK